MTRWRCELELDASRKVVGGSATALSCAIGRGADLRIGTEFRHNEHIDVTSSSCELIREVAEFPVTYSIDGRWSAGIMTLRQPIELPTGFGKRPSMSFFLYNQDGTQGIARPFLDGVISDRVLGPSQLAPPDGMPRYHIMQAWDERTNAPSHNFVYDFDHFRYFVDDSWQQVLHHTQDGRVESGRLPDLIDAFSSGCDIKLGIENLCDNFSPAPAADLVPSHEVFVRGSSGYCYTEQNLFMIGTHPLVRVRPEIPARYRSNAWDFGWLMVRTDGHIVYRRCDPYTLQFTDQIQRHPVRWFVR